MTTITKFRTRTLFASVVLLLAMVLSVNAQTVRTVGTGGDYTTLKAAFDAINAGSITGAIELQIISNVTETASAQLNASGSGSANFSSVKIYPTVSGLSIAGNLAAPLINLNGADNVTIDGRVNGTGTDKELTITNTSTASTSGTSTIRLINDASNNNIKYCTVKGSSTATTSSSSIGGIIVFHTGTSTGNDNNIIEYNNITNAADANRPIYAISSYGSAVNDNNIIRNNNIFNFFKHGTISYGIYLSSYSSIWTITDNSFYEENDFIPTADVGYYSIYVDNYNGVNFTISNNYIGGQAPNCGGNALTKTNAKTNQFCGIYLYVGTATASNVLGNTIQNISWSNYSSTYFYGINISGGLVNIGSDTGGNTIGATTGNSSINFQGGNGGYIYGIYIGANGTTICKNNAVGAITASCLSAIYGVQLYGIYKASGGTTTITNNTIGSTTTTNSIYATNASTTNVQLVYGIYSAGVGNTSISNNTIANITNGTTNATANTNGLINGICCIYGNNTITNNIIRDLSIANANTSTTNSASISGIVLSSNSFNNTVRKNTIYNLTNTYSSFAGNITGIYFMGNTSENQCSENFIYNLAATGASSVAASIFGIKAVSGNIKFANNIISLGGNTSSTIYGFFDSGTSSDNYKVYFNSISIHGNLVSGATNKSYCLFNSSSDYTRDYRNNLFQNSRSTVDGSNLHYAISHAANTKLTCDFNDYYVDGTGGVIGYLSGDKTSIYELRNATGQDANSLNTLPFFVNASGIQTTDYIPQTNFLNGIFIPDVLYDFNNILRLTTSRMGAFEQESSNQAFELWSDGEYFDSYNNLKETFDAINSGAVTGNIEIKIDENSEETATATLNASGTGSASYSSVLIYPTKSLVSIVGNLDMPLINFNGADNVTIDGRMNAEGTENSLFITNMSTSSAAGTSTIRFINDALYNKVQYCNLRGSSTATIGGIVLFHTGITTGNDNNIIENNKLTCASDNNRPVNVIYSSGSSASIVNNNISVVNNFIYNFLNRRLQSYGVNFGFSTSDCSVSGNHFYETTTFFPTEYVNYYPIYINNTSGTNYSILGNFIGGQSSNCGGNAWYKTNAYNSGFYGIYLNIGTSGQSNVQGNTIQNISWSNATYAGFYGICIDAGAVNVGTTAGNKIGSNAGNGSIFYQNGLGGGLYGIYTSGNAVTTIENNEIGSITSASTNSGYPSSIFGIYISSGTPTIKGNTIGSTTTANSIIASSASTSNAQYVYGIYSNSTTSAIIQNNIIANLTNGTTNTSTAIAGLINGIFCFSGTNTITNNIIRDLTISNANNSSTHTASVSGIAFNSNAYINTIVGNKIYNLSNTNPNFTGNIFGIYFTGATFSINQITKNFIHSLSATGISSTATIVGIKAVSGLTLYANNIISIGGNTNSTIYGFYDSGAAGQNLKAYFNTINVYGSLVSGSNSKSYCLYSAASNNQRDYRNNIFENSRSTINGSNLHYSISLTSNTNLTCDYNDYYSGGTGAVLGELSGNKTTLTDWKIATAQDVNSINISANFTNPAGTTTTDFVPLATDIKGIFLSDVLYDYNNLYRLSASRMGAFEQENSDPTVELWNNGTFVNSYINLKGAFDAINSGVATGNLVIKLTENIEETSTATLNASNTGNADYNNVLIYPTKNAIAVMGNLDMPLIDLNGADNVTIDGRQNSEGSSKSLTIINLSSSSTSGTSTLHFVNDASNNTVKNCMLRGASTASTGGIIFFNTGTNTGNDNNTISNNDISCASDYNRPVNAIYSIGTSESIANKNISINGNNFFNFFNRSLNSFGINLNEYNSDCTVSNNSFYETNTFTPTGNGTLTVININSETGNNFSVINNYIGGKTSNCGGDAWTKTNEYFNHFNGISVRVGFNSESNIQGNTIQNISWANGNLSGGNTEFKVIGVYKGLVNIGTEAGNTIGSNIGTNSLNLTAYLQGFFYGIIIDDATTICSNNKIGSITTSSTSGYGYYMYGIYKTSANRIFRVENNTIGSETTANSFDATSRAYNTQFGAWQHQIVYGIFSDMLNGGKTYIENNTIANINNRAETPGKMGTKTIGIACAGGSCENNIINNSIHDLTVANNVEYKDVYGSLTGIAIFQSSSNSKIIGNAIYNLKNTNPSFLGLVCGISIIGNSICSNNFVHSISLNVTSATNADVIGIKNYSGNATISNNIISIGGNYRATINGIYDATAYSLDETKLYFNTIYIHGTLTVYDYYMSSCLFSNSNVGKRDYRNNIFYNARSKTTAGNNQFAAYFNYGTAGNLTLDYNDYYVTGTGGAPVNLPMFTGKDANSISQDPLFTNTGGLNAADYKLSSIKIFGVSETGITEDFGAITRSNCPTMGAWELVPENLWTGNRNDNWGDCHNWTFDVPAPGDNVTFAEVPKNHAVLDINRVIGSLNNAQSTYRPVLNGKTLTMNGALNFTNGAQMDASATGSTLVLSGSGTPQTIGKNFLFQDKMYNLTVNNPQNAYLQGRMILLHSLSATSGVLDASSYEPTIVLGGSQAQTFGGNELQNGEVYNLTIDNAANASLSSNLTVQDTLLLTQGDVNIGDLKLTIQGNTLGNGGYISTNANAGTIEYSGTSAQTIRRIKDNTANSLLVTNTSPEGATIIGTDNSFGDLNTFNQVNVVSGSRLNVAPGEKLTVNNDLTNNGSFVLQSDAQGTATLLTAGTVSTNAGIYKVQQYLAGSNNGSAPNGRFWYMSSPVTGATSATFNPETGLNKLWSWNEPTHSYLQITDNVTPLISGKGYVARMGNTGTVEFSSNTINNGDITVNGLSWTGLTHLNRGYNLIGNPYPSYLNWKDIWVDPNTDELRESGLPNRMRATIWVRSENSTLYTYNAVAGTYATTNPQEGEITESNIQRIAPMQAFWVETYDPEMTDGSITFTNSMRSHQVSSEHRLRAKAATSSEKKMLRLEISDGTNSDQTVIQFNPNAKDSYDLYDSHKMSLSGIPQLYTKVGNEVLSINGMGSFTNEKIVPLGFSVPQAGVYTLKANDISNFSSGTQVLLVDNATASVTDLTLEETYDFTSDKVDNYNRFTIIFRSPGTVTETPITEQGNIVIYRNGDNKITVICNEEIEFNASVTIYTAAGQAIYNKALSGTTTLVNKELIPGVYIARVYNGEKIVSAKVIVE